MPRGGIAWCISPHSAGSLLLTEASLSTMKTMVGPTLAHNSSHLPRKVLDESPPGPGWKLALPGQAQTLSLGEGVLILGAFH